MLDDPVGYTGGDGKDNQIYLGAFQELLLITSNVGTAVVLYPIARRQNEALAIGYVAARIIECVFIAAGIVPRSRGPDARVFASWRRPGDTAMQNHPWGGAACRWEGKSSARAR